MSFHWIVLADANRARFFSSDALLTRFDPVDALDGSTGRSELTPRGSHAGLAVSHGRDVGPREHDETTFARTVADVLQRSRGRYERLVLVAPPRFLGDLRDSLPSDVRGRVVAELHHDYGKLGAQDAAALVRRHLEDHPSPVG